MTEQGQVDPKTGVWVPAAKRQLAAVLRLCVRERLHPDVSPECRWAVTLPGYWGDGFPTREAAVEAVQSRAKEGGGR